MYINLQASSFFSRNFSIVHNSSSTELFNYCVSGQEDNARDFYYSYLESAKFAE